MLPATLILASLLAGQATTQADSPDALAADRLRLEQTRGALQDIALRLEHLEHHQRQAYVLRGAEAAVVRKQLADEITRLRREQAALKATETALARRLKAGGEPVRPTTQPDPLSADRWLLADGQSDRYRSLQAPEEVRAGELVNRATDPDGFDPVLRDARGEVELVGTAPQKLGPLFGKQVEVRGKPRVLPLGGARREFFWAGWIRLAMPPTTQPEQPAPQTAWRVVDGDRRDYQSLQAAEEMLEGQLRRAAGPDEQFVLIVGNDRIPLLGEPLRLRSFEGQRVQVRCRATAPRPERLSPRRVGWILAVPSEPRAEPRERVP